MRTLFRKKLIQDVDRSLLHEPVLTVQDWKDLKEGVQLFNVRKFWHAHEAWEAVWKRHPEESRIFFQGLIQLAAAYHLLLVNKRYGGTMRNFIKAEEKLKLFPSQFIRVDVSLLLHSIRVAREEIGRLSASRLDEFDQLLVPTITLL